MIQQLYSDNPNVSIGVGTYASSNPVLRTHHKNNKIIIGKFCSLAQNVMIFAGGNHPINYVSTHPLKLFFETDNFQSWSNDCGDDYEVTEIGNDVWIGEGATILSGISVGSGSIIGAKSVVASSVPPYCIVAGNPAKILRYRFEPNQIEELLCIEWWNWNIQKIKNNLHLICSSNIDFFLHKTRIKEI